MKNSFKKYLFILNLILLIPFADSVAYNDKTSTVSASYTATSNCIVYGDLGSGYISVNHRVGMTSGGYSVNPGQSISFNYNPDDPYFLLNNGTWDTPYGEWTDSVSNIYYAKFGPYSEMKNSFSSGSDASYMGYIKDHGQFFCGDSCIDQYGYFYWTAVKPSVSIVSSNPGVISCRGMNCTAISPGEATLTSNIDQTNARAWAKVVYTFMNGTYFFMNPGAYADFTGVVTGLYCSSVTTSGISPGSFYLPATSMSWTINVSSPFINGSCGSAQGSYLPTDTTWRVPFCNSGTPSPAAPAFPAIGATTSWQCIGVGAGRNPDPTCTATRNYATPNVNLNINPPTITNINNNTLTPGTTNITLNWNITNESSACNGNCVCNLTDLDSGSTGGDISYLTSNPNTRRTNQTIGSGTHNYSINCRNPQNLSGNAPASITATCTFQKGTPACDKLCGPGNTVTPKLNDDCSITNSSVVGCSGNPNCPAGTQFEEVRP